MARNQSDPEEELEEADEMEEICPGCGMERSAWQGNDGKGYRKGGETYCCQGCAEDTGCTCTA